MFTESDLLEETILLDKWFFLIALAIVDDLGAVIVIAIFYTDTINTVALSLAGMMFGIMLLLNRLGVHKILPY